VKDGKSVGSELIGQSYSDLKYFGDRPSANGLVSHISPSAAEGQIKRVARARGLPLKEVRRLVRQHTEPRQFDTLGEPRVNVFQLNLGLDTAH
jgi:K+-transporting ATPase ATPase C chain